MRAGPVPLGRCAACAPHFKHTPHTCAAKGRGEPAARGELVAGDAPAESDCQACAPHLRHVAHTCGRSYVGKRYGRKRKQTLSKGVSKAALKGRSSPLAQSDAA